MRLPSLSLPSSPSWGYCLGNLGDGKCLVVTTGLVASYLSLVFHRVAKGLDSFSHELLEASSRRSWLEGWIPSPSSSLLSLGGSYTLCRKVGWRRVVQEELLRGARRRLARCKKKTCDVLACVFFLVLCVPPS